MKKYMLFLVSLLFIGNVNALSIKNISNTELKKGSIVTYNIDLGNQDSGELSYDTNIFESLNVNSFGSDVKQSISSNSFIITGKKNFDVTLKVKNDVQSGIYEPIVLKSNNDKVEQEVVINKEESEDFFANLKNNFPFLSPLLIVLVIISVLAIIYSAYKVEGSKKNALITVFSLIAIVCLPLEILILFSKEEDSGVIKEPNVVNYKLRYEEEVKEDEEEKEEEKIIEEQQEDVTDDIDVTTNNYLTTNSNPNVVKPNPVIPNKEESPIEVLVEDVLADSYYANPNNNHKIEFTISSNTDLNVSYAVIDGHKYPVKKISNNKYEVEFKVANKVGVNEYTITNLILDNNLVVSINKKIKVEVLKAKPSISNFKINNQKEVPEISFVLNDKDKAFIKGVIKITNDEGKVIYEKDIKVGENIIPVNLIDNDKYHIDFNILYDLDSNSLNNITGEVNKDSENILEDFKFTRDYNFVARNVAISDKVKKDDDLVLTFENEYISYYDVKKVVIDGEEYEVTKKGNTYQVILNKKDKGLNHVNFEKVILKNDVAFEVGQTLTYVYLKDIPEIMGLDSSINDNKINSSFEIKDVDGAITSIKAILSLEGKVLLTKELDKNAREVDFDVTMAGDYQVKIVASYDLGDKKVLEISRESNETLNVPITSEIIEINNDYYIENNSNFDVTINIKDNTFEDVKSFTIDGNEVNAIKLSDDSYKVTLNATSISGNKTYNIENINYQEENITVSETIEIYTLKNRPEISNVEIDTENLKVTYDISNQDSFVSGKIVIDNDKIIEINKGDRETSIESLNLAQFEDHKLYIVVQYDLDDDVNNGLNSNNVTSGNYQFEIKNDYEFLLNNLTVEEVTIDTIMLKFNSTNASNNKYYVKSVVLNINNNDKSYDVTLNSDGTYSLNIPVVDIRSGDGERGVVLKITKATLNDGKEFSDLDVSATVYKHIPTANISNAVVLDKNNIKALLEIDGKDIEGATYQAELIGEDNSIITQSVDVGSTEVIFNNSEGFKNQKYSVVITGTFDANDHIKYENSVISKVQSIEVPIYVTISSLNDSVVYATKNGQVSLKYHVLDNTDKNITKVTYDGLGEFDAKMDGDTLTVDVTALDTAGEKTYKITSVKYDDNITISDDVKTNIYVLKDKPSISEFSFNDATNTITFKLNNPDEALLENEHVTISKEETKEFVLSLDNTITLDSNYENGIYVVSLNGTYDLGNNEKLPLSDLLNQEINVVTDYKLEFKVDKVEVLNKENVTITFTSSNASKYGISFVKIDGEYISVNENKVVITYNHSDGLSPKKFEITGVKLENGKELDLKENKVIDTYKVKPRATVSDIINSGNNNIKANYEVTGNVSNLKAKLMVKELNSDNYVYKQEQDLTDLSGSVTFTIEDIYNAGDYKIEIYGDFDLVDGLNHSEELISSSEPTVNVPVVIKNVTSTVSSGGLSPSAHYPLKGETVTLTYTVDANTKASFNKADITTYNNVTDLKNLPSGSVETISDIVNGKIYKKALDTPGVIAYKINAVYYNDVKNDVKCEISESLQNSSIQYVDVLKDELDFINVKYTDKYPDDKSVEIDFEIVDRDNVLASCDGNCYVELRPTSGSAQPKGENITDSETGVLTTAVPVKEGLNKVVFRNLTDMQLYMFVINASYDIDSDLLNELYGEKNEGIHSDRHHTMYFISKPADVSLSELKLLKTSGEETSSLKVKENFKLSFKAQLIGDKQDTNAKIKDVNVDGTKYDVIEEDGIYTTVGEITSRFTIEGSRTIYINGVTLELEDGTEEYIYFHKDVPKVNVTILSSSALSIFMLPTKMDFF